MRAGECGKRFLEGYVLMRFRAILSVPIIACLPLIGAAQQPEDPPQILKISHEVLSPGKQAAFLHIAAARSQYLRSVNWPTVSLGLRPITGPSEVLFLTGYHSMGHWADDRRYIEESPVLKAKLDEFADRVGETLSQKRDVSAQLEKDLSYRAKYDWSKVRYIDIIVILLRPGHGDEYLENRKIVVQAHTKAAVEEHMMIYQVSSGYPGTTFLVIRPVETFEGLDLEKAHGERYMKILGEENRQKLHELFAASVATQEEEFYEVDPAISYVTTSWAGSDKNFWLLTTKNSRVLQQTGAAVNERPVNR